MSLNLSLPVLVVDDHPTMVSIVSDVLRQIGFENIDGARDGNAALKKLISKNYGARDFRRQDVADERQRSAARNPRQSAPLRDAVSHADGAGSGAVDQPCATIVQTVQRTDAAPAAQRRSERLIMSTTRNVASPRSARRLRAPVPSQ